MGNPIHYDKLKFYLGCEQKKRKRHLTQAKMPALRRRFLFSAFTLLNKLAHIHS